METLHRFLLYIFCFSLCELNNTASFVQQAPETQILTLNLLGAFKLALALAPDQSHGWQKAVSCTLSQDIGGFSRIVLGLCDDSAGSESSSWRRGKAWQGWKPCWTWSSHKFNTAHQRQTEKSQTTSLYAYARTQETGFNPHVLFLFKWPPI